MPSSSAGDNLELNALLEDVSRRQPNVRFIVNGAGVRSQTINTQGGASILVNLQGSSLSKSELEGLVEETVRKCMVDKNEG